MIYHLYTVPEIVWGIANEQKDKDSFLKGLQSNAR